MMFPRQNTASLVLLSTSPTLGSSSILLAGEPRTTTIHKTWCSKIIRRSKPFSSICDKRRQSILPLHSPISKSGNTPLSSTSLFSTMTSTSCEQTPTEAQMTKDAFKITQAAIHAVNPQSAIEKHLSYDANTQSMQIGTHSYNVSKDTYDEIFICAFGKAATSMAIQTAKIVSQTNLPIKGIAITKYDHATQEQIDELQSYNIHLHFASHPIPDDASVQSSTKLLHLLLKEASSKTFILNCISGGGSALFCTPRPPLTLFNMANVNQQLLACGMPITEMNVIRKKLEIGKGGGLVGLAYPATSVTMVLSDVIGDPLDLIASGPSVPDTSTWDDAWCLLERYDLREGGLYELEPCVIDVLNKGRVKNGELSHVEDLPSKDHPMFCTECPHSDTKSKISETILVGNNAQAVYAAAEEAQRLGYNPIILGTTIEGEAMHIANMYISMAEQAQLQKSTQRSRGGSNLFPFTKLPAAMIGGGETTVTLAKNHGKGGRNQEIGLAAALRMQSCGMRDVVLASVGTDGTDGPTDAAGAVVDGGTIARVEAENGGEILGKDALERHDAYTFFDSCSDESTPLVKTGPTGTNVADVMLTLIQ